MGAGHHGGQRIDAVTRLHGNHRNAQRLNGLRRRCAQKLDIAAQTVKRRFRIGGLTGSREDAETENPIFAISDGQ